MKDKFEISLFESGNTVKKSLISMASNVGRITAIITLVITALVLFTDIGFSGFDSKSFTSTLLVMLISSYVMYFSMEEAGERLGEESDAFKEASKKFAELRARISGSEIDKLRSFSSDYSARELEYRRQNLLMTHGYSEREYAEYKAGASASKEAVRVFRLADKLKAVPITPKELLSYETSNSKSELTNPKSSKLCSMFLRMLPTTFCMTVTVSVMLTAKDSLTLATVAEGLFKLSSLVIIGFRGYATGYSYTKERLTLWLETKSRVLSAFIDS